MFCFLEEWGKAFYFQSPSYPSIIYMRWSQHLQSLMVSCSPDLNPPQKQGFHNNDRHTPLQLSFVPWFWRWGVWNCYSTLLTFKKNQCSLLLWHHDYTLGLLHLHRTFSFVTFSLSFSFSPCKDTSTRSVQLSWVSMLCSQHLYHKGTCNDLNPITPSYSMVLDETEFWPPEFNPLYHRIPNSAFCQII